VGRVPGKVKVPRGTVLYGRRWRARCARRRTESQNPVTGYLSLKVHLPSWCNEQSLPIGAYDKGPGAQEPDECESLTSGSVVGVGAVRPRPTTTSRKSLELSFRVNVLGRE
jgi:hypothetical protein